MGKRSRCTPSRETSAELPPLLAREAILSISSKKIIPVCSVRRMAFWLILSLSTSRSASSLRRYSKASGTRTIFFSLLPGNILAMASCMEFCISSIPGAEKISTEGVCLLTCISISTLRSLSSPRRSISRKRSLVLDGPDEVGEVADPWGW